MTVTPDDRPLIRAALLAGADAAAEWARWRESHTLDDLDGSALFVGPLLYRNLARSGAPVDVADHARLKGIYRRSWYENQLLLHAAAEILRRLHEQGIETMLVKGAALALLHYRDTGARPMSDVDVLVPPERASAAIALLESAGWTPRVPRRPQYRRVRHSLGFTAGLRREIDVDWSPLRERAGAKEIWRSSVPLAVHGVETRAPSAADQVLIAAVHGARRDSLPLLGIADVAVLAGSGEVDWDRLVEDARDRHLSLHLQQALESVHELGVADVPEEVVSRLRAIRRPPHERLGFRGATRRPSAVNELFVHWDHHRRLRRAGLGAPPTFAAYLRAVSGVSTNRELVSRLQARSSRSLRDGPLRPLAATTHSALVRAEVAAVASLDALVRRPDERTVDDVTAVVKTFERPAALRRLLRSIRRLYPTLRVIVVDDSRDPAGLDGVEVVPLPYRSGTSRGRNEGLRRVETRYVLLLDDDFVFYRGTRVGDALALLDEHPEIDVLGRELLKLPLLQRQPRRLDGPLLPTEAAPVAPIGSTVGGLAVAASVPNFFVARTDRLALVPWDPELRVGEHAEFFTRALGTLLTVFDPRFRCLHAPTPFDRAYMESRLDVSRERLYLARRYQGS